ncbi:hypothetical protein L2E82_39027 [Cichorium intybus]|uniref:Uncharacterized protein n=1 Tax=Cichorium intybus TaxID=13427 RepID=A0ACB9AGC7_CICIN|nr:hypothetical protein L2E82_39027 [Cichorium intybus]
MVEMLRRKRQVAARRNLRRGVNQILSAFQGERYGHWSLYDERFQFLKNMFLMYLVSRVDHDLPTDVDLLMVTGNVADYFFTPENISLLNLSPHVNHNSDVPFPARHPHPASITGEIAFFLRLPSLSLSLHLTHSLSSSLTHAPRNLILIGRAPRQEPSVTGLNSSTKNHCGCDYQFQFLHKHYVNQTLP